MREYDYTYEHDTGEAMHSDLTQRLPDMGRSNSCHWPLPPEDPWLCHHYTHIH